MAVEVAESVSGFDWPHISELHGRSSGSRASTIVARAEAVERVTRAMRERLEEPMSLQAMADTALLSPYHFNRVFSEVTGVSPSRFLAALRFEAAKRLLLTTEASVTEICFEVGYNSLGTFTTHFTEAVGVSPRGLRRVRQESVVAQMRALADEMRGPGRAMGVGPSLAGWITATGAFDGPVFVGLFTTPVPQGRPVCCTLLSGPGPYCLPDLSDGAYYAFAAAFPWSHDPLAYLLPRHSEVYIGATGNPIVVDAGAVTGGGDMELRSLRSTDPPMLIALPVLVAERSTYDWRCRRLRTLCDTSSRRPHP